MVSRDEGKDGEIVPSVSDNDCKTQIIERERERDSNDTSRQTCSQPRRRSSRNQTAAGSQCMSETKILSLITSLLWRITGEWSFCVAMVVILLQLLFAFRDLHDFFPIILLHLSLSIIRTLLPYLR